jgi:hypothetical protein
MLVAMVAAPLALVGVAAAPASAGNPPEGTITTIAGTGTPGNTGDGGPATSAQLNLPSDTVVSPSGTTYISDYNANVVRAVSPGGAISTVAGTGTAGYTGDNGPATSAELDGPAGLALDGSGNLYIADYLNHVVREVSPSGTITTMAGTGTFDSSGDGGPATSATLRGPVSVAVDLSGNRYIADRASHDVRKVTPAGIISTFAGTGADATYGDGGPATAAAFLAPSAVATDRSGNLYIADSAAHVVRKVDPTGTINAFAGDGTSGNGGDGDPAVDAQLGSPTGVVAAANGTVYIADSGLNYIRAVAPAPGNTMYTLAGNGSGTNTNDNGAANFAGLDGPTGLSLDPAGNLLLATHGATVRKIWGVAPSGQGYWLAGADGGIFAFGDAGFYGSAGSLTLDKPIVGMAASPDAKGYDLVASDGGIFSFGDASFHGSTGGMTLNKPIVGMALTPDGGGYWMVGADGGIFAFGDAGFYGSTGSLTLNQPIVAMTASPDGRGYWLVAADGGIFSFGDAGFHGSTGSTTLNRPIVGMATTPDGLGYWLVGSDGGIFSFGDAAFSGSTGSITLNKPIVDLAATPDGQGYWLVGSDGGIFSFGDAPFLGSTGGQPLNAPIVQMAVAV